MQDSFSTQIEEIIENSQLNFIFQNTDFFARLLFENLNQKSCKETISRYYIQQKMYQQVVELLKKPQSELESYYLGVACFHLQMHSEAMNALLSTAKNDKLRVFLRNCEFKEIENVLLEARFREEESRNDLYVGQSLFSPTKKTTEKNEVKSAKESLSFDKKNQKSFKSKILDDEKLKKTPKTEKLKVENSRKMKTKKLIYRNEEFASECVANGAYGFFYLGMTFEQDSKLEQAALCYRNSYRLDNRIYYSYIKFVETIAKIEFENSFSQKGKTDGHFLFFPKNMRDASKLKLKSKTAGSVKLMNYLLQTNENQLLCKRVALPSSNSPDRKKRGKKTKPSLAYLTMDSSIKNTNPFGTTFPNPNCDKILQGSFQKKENQNLLKSVPSSRTEVYSGVETKLTNNKIITGSNFVENEITALKSSQVLISGIHCESKRLSRFESIQTMPDKSTHLRQKENNEFCNEPDHLHNSPKLENINDPILHIYPITKSKTVKTKNTSPNISEILLFLRSLKEGIVHFSFNEYPQAIQAFESYNAPDPTVLEIKCSFALVVSGRCFINMMKYEQASKIFELAVQVNPNVTDGLEYYSSCLWYTKDIAQLLDLERKTSQNFKSNCVNSVIHGNFCSAVKKTDDAIVSFKSAVKHNPSDSYALCLLGHELVFLEDYKSAKECYFKALETDSQQFNAYWGLGNIYLQIDDSQSALVYFYNALAVNPHCALIYSYIGVAHLNLNSSKKALENFEKSEQLIPDSTMNLYHISLAYFKMGDFNRAAIGLQNLLQGVKNEPKLFVLLGKVYQKLGRIQDAHECFAKAINLDPRDSQGKIRELFEMINTGENLEESKYLFGSPL